MLILLILLFTFNSFAQNEKEWTVADPHGPQKKITFTTSEGTWMNLDVSPDGTEIVFDLLGDIYSIPIGGGNARLLTGGSPWEVQPRYSPDGKKILFTSDRGGGDNIWVMDRAGTNLKQITKEDFRLLNNAVWMPGGDYIVAKKHFTSGRSLGAGELWMYHITGGAGIQLTKRKNDQMDVGEPYPTPDGKYIYFSEDMSPGTQFEYNKDPNGQIYMVRRVDLKDGSIDNIITGPGGAVRPVVSRDGSLLAFVRRIRTKSVLFLHDLKTGEQWPVYEHLNKDQQETWATFGVYPNYAFTPDNKSIIFWAGGKINRIDIETLNVDEIPFTASVDQYIADAVLYPQQVHTDNFTAMMIRNSSTAPGGKFVVFNAAGYLWKKELPDGTPRRLTQGRDFEFYPSVSPDGKSVVFTTWNDSLKGSVMLFTIGSGSLYKITPEPGYYFHPRFSPDGKSIIYRKGGGDQILGFTYSQKTGLYIAPSGGGSHKLLIDEGSTPVFSGDGTRVYYMSSEGENKALKSVDLTGSDKRTHFTSKYAVEIVPSPDGKWVAFTELFNTYIAAIPAAGTPLELSAGMNSVPVFRVTRDAGSYIHWSPESDALHWTMGDQYFTRRISDTFAWLPQAPDSIMPPDTAGIALDLHIKSDVPEGSVLFINARVITMKGNEVIENGSILVQGNKIKRAAPGTIDHPADAKVFDLKGKTIIPGLIDVHAHIGVSWQGITPQQSWPYYTNLAYGVTTTHDPSNSTEMVFSQSEMIKAGWLVGPRIYSTGTILYGAEGDFKAVINSLEDARSHMRRMKAVGAFSVKSYNQPRRDQRQQVIQAARELNMHVYPEGGSFFYHNMSMILDGHTGIEHSIPVAPVYKDVVDLWRASKTGYTPTLIVAYGGIWGENYWYQKTNVWENEQLLKYYPRGVLDARSRRRMMVPDDDFGHIYNAKTAKMLADSGVSVQLGAHGQLQGLGVHWELWNFVLGGFSNHEALRAATLKGAEYLGMEKEIGSIEEGKLADLVILDKNPLDDIQNSNTVNMVMMNGRLYDASTMNEIGNYDRKRQKFFWEYSRTSDNFDWHAETGSFLETRCSCFH